MQITVTEPGLEAFIREEVEAGRFDTPEEVIASAIGLMRSRDQSSSAALKAAIAVGIEQADRGEVVAWDPDAIRRESERRLASERAASSTGL